jgi:mannosyltransferase OCH1-like enzyme
MGINWKAFKYLPFCCGLLSASLSAELIYPDFMLSMTRAGEDFRKFEEYFIENQQHNECYKTQNLEIYRTCYTRNILQSKQSTDEYRIPRIIHQIWLGSPVPYKYFDWMQTWANMRGWEYKLWTEEDLSDFLLYNQDLYDESSNFGEKSDLLRLELLLHYGGVYVDIDFECVNSSVFEELHRHFDFYAGFEPICHGTINGTYKICNAIFAACPHHPIIKNLIIGMKANWKNHQGQTAVQKSGPDYFSRIILDYEKGHLSSPEVKSNNAEYRNMYLPCTFLYPFSEPDIRGMQSHEDLLSRISPETAAIHYWSGSWIFPGGR